MMDFSAHPHRWQILRPCKVMCQNKNSAYRCTCTTVTVWWCFSLAWHREADLQPPNGPFFLLLVRPFLWSSATKRSLQSTSWHAVIRHKHLCPTTVLLRKRLSLEPEKQLLRLNSRAQSTSYIAHQKLQGFGTEVLCFKTMKTWPTYMQQDGELNSFEMRCLGNTVVVASYWRDRIRYEVTLTGCFSLFSFLKTRRLRWPGHTFRLSDCRLP